MKQALVYQAVDPACSRVGRAGTALGFVRIALATGRLRRHHSSRFSKVQPAKAHGIVGAAAHQGGCHRVCQQDCADGLGDDGQARALH
jgi:hypothetical protein